MLGIGGQCIASGEDLDEVVSNNVNDGNVRKDIRQFICLLRYHQDPAFRLFQQVHGVGWATAEQWVRAGYGTLEDVKACGFPFKLTS